jgi:hypothetical protein
MDFCISDACAQTTCPNGQICQLDANGVAACIDPCSGVTCPSGYRCSQGLCIDDSCLNFGCPDGELCINSMCQPDPCANVMCDANEYCSPETGTCVKACLGPCPNGEQCVDGMCDSDPCSMLHCAEDQSCFVTNGVGMCVTNQCLGVGCTVGLACCGGTCITDPCGTIACPGASKCVLTSSCTPACVAETPEEIVGAGGGGFACDVAGGLGARAQVSHNAYWLLLAVGAWLLTRRRRDAR